MSLPRKVFVATKLTPDEITKTFKWPAGFETTPEMDEAEFIVVDLVNLPGDWVGYPWKKQAIFVPTQNLPILFVALEEWVTDGSGKQSPGEVTKLAIDALTTPVTPREEAAKKVEGMGLGDVKMMAMLGATLGWMPVFPLLVLASVGGTLAGIVVAVKSPKGMQVALPFRSTARLCMTRALRTLLQ